MKNYIHIDGKDIEISQKTAENLKKQFTEEETFEPGDIIYDYFGTKMRIIQKGGYCDGVNKFGLLLESDYIMIDNSKWVEVVDINAIPRSALEDWLGEGVTRVEDQAWQK